MNMEIIIADPSASDSTWEFLDGSKRSAVNLRTSFVGIGTYQPGWRWSEHVGKQTGKPSQNHRLYAYRSLTDTDKCLLETSDLSSCAECLHQLLNIAWARFALPLE
jgi:hypothetical protein